MKLIKILVVAAVLTVAAQAHAFTQIETAAICAGNYHVIAQEAMNRNRGDIYSAAIDSETNIYRKFVSAPGFQEKYAAAQRSQLDWPTRASLAENCTRAGF